MNSKFGWLVGAVAIVVMQGFVVHGQQKAADESSPEAVLAFREAVNFQKNGALEIAAEEWQKFLKEHGKEPLAAWAQHYLGACQFQLKQYDEATKTLQAVVERYPNFEQLEDALFNLASSQYALAVGSQQRGEASGHAARTFGELLKKFPTGKHTNEALYYQGEAL